MSEEAPATVGIAALAIDCSDPMELARWWSRMLGGTVEVHPQGYATLHTPEESMEMLGIRLPQAAPRPPYRDTIA